MSLALNIYDDKKKRDFKYNLTYGKKIAKYISGADMVWQSDDFEFNEYKVGQIIRLSNDCPLPYEIKLIIPTECFRKLLWPVYDNKFKCDKVYFLKQFTFKH